MILGLTGSIGSGKTFVSSALERLGATVIRADDIAREVVKPGTEAHAEIAGQFGTRVLKEDATLDRQKLAEIVFADPAKRQLLESIIHPRVRQRELELIAQSREQPLVVLEIPLLYEAKSDDLCDAVAVVTVGERERRERLNAGRGMNTEEIEARLGAQLPQEEKVRRADYVIDNSGTAEQTLEAVTELFRRLTAPRPS